MNTLTRRLVQASSGLLLLASLAAHAEPYLAVQQGLKCAACHVNPTGGGLRTAFGIAYATYVMPQSTPTGSAALWSGKAGELVRLGGDLRASASRSDVPHSPSSQTFGLDQLRLYADVSIIPDRLQLYVDEALAPGNARIQEGYIRYGDAQVGWYLKGGQFYLPFGWRLQDQTALVREVSGISMTTPDSGLELGLERGDWSAQLDLTKGVVNAGSPTGYQLTAQAVRVQNRYRVGVAGSFTHSAFGNRGVGGLFAGVRTGPVSWLGEMDLVRDAGFAPGTRTLAAALGEVDWLIRKGQNLKFTAEYFDPDRAIAQDQKVRWSLLYELTPAPFVQLRFGLRRYSGIPQNDIDNRSLAFIELHGFL